MRVGSLVKHIEYEYIGVVIQQGLSTSDRWRIHFRDALSQRPNPIICYPEHIFEIYV